MPTHSTQYIKTSVGNVVLVPYVNTSVSFDFPSFNRTAEISADKQYLDILNTGSAANYYYAEIKEGSVVPAGFYEVSVIPGSGFARLVIPTAARAALTAGPVVGGVNVVHWIKVNPVNYTIPGLKNDLAEATNISSQEREYFNKRIKDEQTGSIELYCTPTYFPYVNLERLMQYTGKYPSTPVPVKFIEYDSTVVRTIGALFTSLNEPPTNDGSPVKATLEFKIAVPEVRSRTITVFENPLAL